MTTTTENTSSFAVVDAADTTLPATETGPSTNPAIASHGSDLRSGLKNDLTLTETTSAVNNASVPKELQLTGDLAKAIMTLWNRQPENVMPSPGPASMPGLTEFANQKGMENGDGRYTGWQGYSTFAFVRYRSAGQAERLWNIYSSLMLGTNVLVQPPVSGSKAPPMSAKFDAFWAALNVDVTGSATRSNVTAAPYDDETGAMMWIANRLQKQPAHWFDEDVFLRLLALGMLCPKTDWLNEDRLMYVVDPELVDAKIGYSKCSPKHSIHVQAIAIPIDTYITILTGKGPTSGIFDYAMWDKNVAIIPVRVTFEGTWMIPYTFAHLTSAIWNAQTFTVFAEKGHTRLDAMPLASLCYVPGPEHVIFVLIDCIARNSRTGVWRLGSVLTGMDVPIWYGGNQEVRTVSIESLFWTWLGDAEYITTATSVDIGLAWHNLCRHRQVGSRVMSVVMMASELFSRRFWPRGLRLKSKNQRESGSANSVADMLRGRVSDNILNQLLNELQLGRRRSPVNAVTHRVDTAALTPPTGWVTRWVKPDESYQRNYSHLGLYHPESQAPSEVFWVPKLPTDAPPPYIVELDGMPEIRRPKEQGGNISPKYGVVTDRNYYKHFDVVPCEDWYAAFNYVTTGDVKYTLVTLDAVQDMPTRNSNDAALNVDRWWVVDIADTALRPNPSSCGLWWSRTDEVAQEINDRCECAEAFRSYESGLVGSSDAKAAFVPAWMLRSSPHMRGWNACWSLEQKPLAMTGHVERPLDPVVVPTGGGQPNWYNYGYTVATGSHVWRVAALMEMFNAEGAPPEFFDARRIALVVKGTSALAGAVWEAYLGSRGIQPALALGLFRAMNSADVILENLWEPTCGHVGGWSCNSTFWTRRSESLTPIYLLYNDSTTTWNEVWTSVTPHYEMKMVLEKFGLWRETQWPLSSSSIRLADDSYVTGVIVKRANDVLTEDQLGESLSAGFRVPRCMVFGFRGRSHGEWIESIVFGGPWQLYDHCAYRSDTTIHHERIMQFGMTVHPTRPPRFCLALAQLPTHAMWVNTVVSLSGDFQTRVTMEWPDPNLIQTLYGVGKGLYRAATSDVIGGLADAGIATADYISSVLRGYAAQHANNGQGE